MTDSDLFRNPGLGSLLQYHLKVERVVWRVLEFAILWLRSGFFGCFLCSDVFRSCPESMRLEMPVWNPA